MRWVLFLSMGVGLISGFALPMVLARSAESDVAFVFLAVFNPILMFLSFDQRKRLLLLGDDTLSVDRSIRLFVSLCILLVGLAVSISVNSDLVYGVILIKLFSFLLEFEHTIYQREMKWLKVLLFRLIELSFLFIFSLLDVHYFEILGTVTIIFMLVKFTKGFQIRPFSLSDLGDRFMPGLQSAATSFISGMPIYIIELSSLSITVTEYAVQATLLNGFYMMSSLHYSGFADKIKEFSFTASIIYTRNIFLFNLLLLSFGTFVIYYLEMTKLLFDRSVIFNVYSLFIFGFVLFSILKNYIYTISYKVNGQKEVAMLRVLTLFFSIALLPIVDVIGIYAFVALLIVHLVEVYRGMKFVYGIHRKL